jgi:MoxR-like ATPase
MSTKVTSKKLKDLRAELDKAVIGYESEKDLIIKVLIAGGNVLLRAVPGTGKTTLINALMRGIEDCQVSRIQLTPDLKPSDLIGAKIWDPGTRQFVTVWGPVVQNDGKPVNLVLADELNRTPGKTLSALLQPAQEKSVTIGDETRQMEELYMISATINPVEQEGTYQLPEAMTDRFAVLIDLGYLPRQQEIQMLTDILRNKRKSMERVKKVVSTKELLAMRDVVDEIAAQTSDAVIGYVVDLVRATRPKDESFAKVHGANAEKLGKAIQYGASPRAFIWGAYLAASHAFFVGDDVVTVDHIKSVMAPVLNHRVILQASAMHRMSVTDEIVNPILEQVPVVNGNLVDKK